MAIEALPSGIGKSTPCGENDLLGIVGHHLWWMTHLPHGSGVTAGFYSNWWQYIVNYDRVFKDLPPPGATFEKAKVAMYAPD